LIHLFSLQNHFPLLYILYIRDPKCEGSIARKRSIEDISKKRNHIAHNPIVSDKPTFEAPYILLVRNAPDKVEKMSAEDVKAFVNKTSDVMQRMVRLLPESANCEKKVSNATVKMTTSEALQIIKSLANGRCPITGQILPDRSAYQQANVVSALNMAVCALDRFEKREKRDSSLPGHAGKLWDMVEDKQLCEEFSAGKSISELADLHMRTTGAIQSRLEKLGKLPPRPSNTSMATGEAKE